MRFIQDQTWGLILCLTRGIRSAIQEGDGERLLQLLDERGQRLETLRQDQGVPEGLRQELLALDEENRNGIGARLDQARRELHLLTQGRLALAAYTGFFREAVFIDRAL